MPDVNTTASVVAPHVRRHERVLRLRVGTRGSPIGGYARLLPDGDLFA